MPATKQKKRKTVKGQSKKKPAQTQPRLSGSASLVLAALGGAALGLSAPGIDQWYMAWFGLVPLLLLTAASSGMKEACLRGLVFGTVYHMVYANWYLQLHPLTWMGFAWWQSMLVAAAAWIIVSLQQGVITSLIAVLIRVIPFTGGVMPRTVEEKWKAPALLLIPLLWVLMQNKIGNAPDFLGVPWTMVEYSQYKQLGIIQCASLIGGIGISYLIVMSNVALATVIATFSQRLSLKSLASASNNAALTQALGVALCITGAVAWGYAHLGTNSKSSSEAISVVQGNVNIEMQKTTKPMSLSELVSHYERLVAKTPPGICIWTESALPTYLKEEKETLSELAQLSKDGKRDMIIGSLDKDFDGKPYNSAFGLASNGKLAEGIYHKRYLVPFGEYMPAFVHYLPDWIQKLTSTPAGVGFNAGKVPVVLDLSGHKIAPLICFETLSPELAVSSVRNGGTLLVNLSDLAWFHDSICGDQMIAFSVLRAVETDRYFVFAANTGPSAVIDNHGRIVARSELGKETVLKSKVLFNSERTAFTDWFN